MAFSLLDIKGKTSYIVRVIMSLCSFCVTTSQIYGDRHKLYEPASEFVQVERFR